ncbi:PREDICTED: keratin-associated protein 4-9-like, partial [Lipotes vexillifer]|uniref:Keratin-associated protein 4-9-like n=1 Tax=Lipotes vexillifer TaxID=118797 RepID=A0A340WNK7_LIPVE
MVSLLCKCHVSSCCHPSCCLHPACGPVSCHTTCSCPTCDLCQPHLLPPRVLHFFLLLKLCL